MDKQVELNSKGTNKLIKATILSDEKMREIGFTNHYFPNWYFNRLIQFGKSNKEFRRIEISFNVTIPKDGSDISIDVLDEDFCQPYDYQAVLEYNPNLKCALIVKEQVEEWMKYLQDNEVLSGHVYGEYI